MAGEISKQEGFWPEVKFITLYDRTDDILAAFEIRDRGSIIEGYDPKSFTPFQLDNLSRTIGKRYESLIAYEIEDEMRPDGVIPYFLATVSGASYDVTSMGTGELSVVYISWLMDYIKDHSILLIEEPEAMLTPTGHLSVFDIIKAGALTRRAAVVLTTNSSNIVNNMDTAQLIALRRREARTRCHLVGGDKTALLQSLGYAINKSLILFVEDKLAELVASDLISRFNVQITKHIEFVIPGVGFGDIKKAITNFPTLGSFSIIGLLDGDMKAEALSWAKKDICCFLPFERSMEREFLDLIASDVSGFASLPGRSSDAVELALSQSHGQEVHDEFHDFRIYLSLTVEQLSKHCTQHWLQQSASKVKYDEFTTTLEAMIRLMRPTLTI
ncbi:hypothetical protein MKK69_11980 [Methylobacterium sp. J-026]|uniref:hypothetical protein n=1 Tax=Methylobacterium sp. J-026 TaxID=2836624 RepID=UPI001FB87176|nr:hypothetical protein [Methylobacterium sp. J-026]MCJ2134768.1 hypothetical protein [Methylobacterium sp. J-026]